MELSWGHWAGMSVSQTWADWVRNPINLSVGKFFYQFQHHHGNYSRSTIPFEIGLEAAEVLCSILKFCVQSSNSLEQNSPPLSENIKEGHPNTDIHFWLRTSIISLVFLDLTIPAWLNRENSSKMSGSTNDYLACSDQWQLIHLLLELSEKMYMVLQEPSCKLDRSHKFQWPLDSEQIYISQTSITK